ncbi:hypothetical protein ACFLSX_03705 [Calditrichota bacterium]
MSEKWESNHSFRIKLISIINGIAALLHLIFWILAFTRLPSISSFGTVSEQMNLATTYGFGIADIIWSVPFLLLGSIALWKNKLVGWMGAYFANVLYWYSFTVIILRDLTADSISPGTILFLPFALFAFWAAYYLWKVQSSFLHQNT